MKIELRELLLPALALRHGDGHRPRGGVAGGILGLNRDGVNAAAAGATALGSEVEREGAGDFILETAIEPKKRKKPK